MKLINKKPNTFTVELNISEMSWIHAGLIVQSQYTPDGPGINKIRTEFASILGVCEKFQYSLKKAKK